MARAAGVAKRSVLLGIPGIPRPAPPHHPRQHRIERLPRVARAQRQDPREGVGVGVGGEEAGVVAVARLPGVGCGAGEEAGADGGVGGRGSRRVP
ncbi:hypothetical protein CQR58_008860 [Streptomyces acidiscabies]